MHRVLLYANAFWNGKTDDFFRKLQEDGEIFDYTITLEGGAESKLKVKEREGEAPSLFCADHELMKEISAASCCGIVQQ